MTAPFYGSIESAFGFNPDHWESFLHQSYADAIETVLAATRLEAGFIVVTGAPGIGKTTLVADLVAHFRAEHYLVGRLTTAEVNGDDLLRSVAFAFGIRAATLRKADLLFALGAEFAREKQTRRPVLLVVDEAQHLEPGALEELRLLCNLAMDHEAGMQIMLVGQEQLWETLCTPDCAHIHQLVVTSCRLRRLTAGETRGYIAHRLRQSGWKGNPRISGQALSLVHARTRGVPRLVNLVMGRLLVHGGLDQLESIEAQDAEKVLAELEKENLAIQPEAPPQDATCVLKQPSDPLDAEITDLASATESFQMLPVKLPHARHASRSPTGVNEREFTPVEGVIARVSRWPQRLVIGGLVVVLLIALNGDLNSTRQAGTASARKDKGDHDAPLDAANRSLPALQVASAQAAVFFDRQWFADVSANRGRRFAAAAENIVTEPESQRDPLSIQDRSRLSRRIGSDRPDQDTPLSDPLPSTERFDPRSLETTGSGAAAVGEGEKGETQILPPLNDLLERAKLALADNRLTVPKGDSAYDHYRSVLARDPENARARSGLRKIVRSYRVLAREKMRKGDLNTARRFARRGLRINSKDPQLRSILAQTHSPRVAPREEEQTPFTQLAEWLRSGDSRQSFFLSD